MERQKRPPKQYDVCWPFALQCFKDMWKIHSYSFSVSQKLQIVMTECSNDSVISVPRQSIVLLILPTQHFASAPRFTPKSFYCLCCSVSGVACVGFFEENLTFSVSGTQFVWELSYQTAVILTSVICFSIDGIFVRDVHIILSDNLTTHI